MHVDELVHLDLIVFRYTRSPTYHRTSLTPWLAIDPASSRDRRLGACARVPPSCLATGTRLRTESERVKWMHAHNITDRQWALLRSAVGVGTQSGGPALRERGAATYDTVLGRSRGGIVSPEASTGRGCDNCERCWTRELRRARRGMQGRWVMRTPWHALVSPHSRQTQYAEWKTPGAQSGTA